MLDLALESFIGISALTVASRFNILNREIIHETSRISTYPPHVTIYALCTYPIGESDNRHNICI